VVRSDEKEGGREGRREDEEEGGAVTLQTVDTMKRSLGMDPDERAIKDAGEEMVERGERKDGWEKEKEGRNETAGLPGTPGATVGGDAPVSASDVLSHSFSSDVPSVTKKIGEGEEERKEKSKPLLPPVKEMEENRPLNGGVEGRQGQCEEREGGRGGGGGGGDEGGEGCEGVLDDVYTDASSYLQFLHEDKN